MFVSGTFCEQGVRDWVFVEDQDRAEQRLDPVQHLTWAEGGLKQWDQGEKVPICA